MNDNTTADTFDKIDDLLTSLDKFLEETPYVNKQIMEKVDEVRRHKDIIFALEFVDFTRQLYAMEDCSYYDYISEKMRQYKKERIDAMPVRFIEK